MARKYWAKRPFDYAGKSLDRGQVFELVGARNDEKLVRLGYCAPLDRTVQPAQCGMCGEEFLGIPELDAHGKKRHSGRALTPQQEDARDEREEKMLQELSPLGPVT